jgi:hypothetical protein
MRRGKDREERVGRREACGVSETRHEATRRTATLVQKAGLRESTREETMEEGADEAERGRDEMRCARRRGAKDGNHTTRKRECTATRDGDRNWGKNRCRTGSSHCQIIYM